ncbi:TetR/AcrR family transcriptional regulator [Virgibacillus natechei]|uniref:TetR/AcrR family transcriptional regulator n=1 Tax=Virgibacillus natechei TaxID=1216297 RepID=A0ABS4IHL8_9BACI|nr:TetR/AcrR family transcriptional regulator [Virgibacillus natechei]MBP1970070.1 TetR/AcrR family transcriptional regulator [Virgibacillus natechei]UZD14151.1 TetR/AcrR family transcriptional regulator [Virgibacillus natechei]
MLENKRGLILDSAANSFSMYGFKGTTMDKVASLAGVGKGTIYTVFDNKEDLFDAVLQQIIIEMEHIFYKCILPEKSVSDNLYEALNQLLEFRKEHQVMMKLTYEVRMFGTDHSKQALDKIEDAIIQCVESQLIQAVEQKKIYASEPSITAFLLYKLYMSLVFDYEEKYGRLDKDLIAKIFQQHFMYALIHNKEM